MWSPPPVMLRPLGVGERIDTTFKIWARNFVTMAKAMLVIAVPAGVVEALISISSAGTTSTTSFGSSNLTTTSSDPSTVLGGTVIDEVIVLFVTALSVATLYRIIGNAYLGRPVRWNDALRHGVRRMLPATWIYLLTYLVIALPVLVAVVLTAVLAAVGATVVAALVGVVLGIGSVVFVVWFWTSAHLAIPLMMQENIRGSAAIRRSMRLVRGSWWSVFGTLLLVFLITYVASSVLGGILIGVGIVAHGDTLTVAIADFFVRTVVLVVLTPLSASVAVVLTIDMQVRKEGYDIQILAMSMGTSVGPEALSFIRPQPYGPPGYPPQPYGAPPGYPPQPYGAPAGYAPPATHPNRTGHPLATPPRLPAAAVRRTARLPTPTARIAGLRPTGLPAAAVRPTGTRPTGLRTPAVRGTAGIPTTGTAGTATVRAPANPVAAPGHPDAGSCPDRRSTDRPDPDPTRRRAVGRARDRAARGRRRTAPVRATSVSSAASAASAAGPTDTLT